MKIEIKISINREAMDKIKNFFWIMTEIAYHPVVLESSVKGSLSYTVIPDEKLVDNALAELSELKQIIQSCEKIP